MNETKNITNQEFVFRRKYESFDQFLRDVWQSVPVWLLAIVLALIVARVVYRYANAARRTPGAPDAVAKLLKVGMWVALAALVVWFATAFYKRDVEAVKALTDATAAQTAARDAGDAPSAAEAGSQFGDSRNATNWYFLVAGLFLLGAVFVVWMYVRDMRTVRWYFALPLALLRISVYAILCLVFLLPAWEISESSTTVKQSRVVVLIDITPSMTKISDDPDSGGKPRTRMDVLIQFLADEGDEKVAFLKKLLDKNPVAVYAFGTRVDEMPTVLDRGAEPWARSDWEAFARYDFKPLVSQGLSGDAKNELRAGPEWGGDVPGTPDWAARWIANKGENLQAFARVSDPGELDKLRKNLERLDKRIDVARTIALGTNVVDSVTAALNREAPNMIQGIIVFSDGRSNLGSGSGYAELRERAQKEKIPIFTVLVGEDRQKASTTAVTITEIVAPDPAPSDEAFKVIVEADGVNMVNQEVDVELHLYKPGTELNPVRPDTMLPVLEADGRPPRDHILTEKLKFAPGDPPHGSIEFLIDPKKLVAVPGLTKTIKDSTGADKTVLIEGSWGVRAFIKKQQGEAFTGTWHTFPEKGKEIQVVQQKLRILLVAGAPSLEFSFLRTLLVREMQDKRVTVTTFVQNDAGTTNKLTAEEGEVIITRFPNRYVLDDKKSLPEDKPYNLNEYDVIIAFDPDWSELSDSQAQDLARWVKEGGGGFIYIAGPVNTFQLARVEDKSRLSPLANMLPVGPADIIALKIQRTARTPRRLYLYPEKLLGGELLKLDDRVKDDPVAGWEPFFTDRDKYVKDPDLRKELRPERGFYSCYPLVTGQDAVERGFTDEGIKPDAVVLAEFVDESETGQPVKRPWLVTNNLNSNWRIAFIASAQMYRMRSYEPETQLGREYFERFWLKMVRFVTAKRNIKQPRGRVLVNKEGVLGMPLRVQARLLDESAKPYPIGRIDPKFTVERSADDWKTKRVAGPYSLAPRPTPSGEFDGYYAGQVPLTDPLGTDDPFFVPKGKGTFKYRVVVEVPDAPGENFTGEFEIRASDPEMDNVAPDDLAMRRIATPYDETLRSRLSPQVSKELAVRLPKDGNDQVLAFRLAERDLLKLIPECMTTYEEKSEVVSPPRYEDIWDDGLPKVESETGVVNEYLLSWWSGAPVSWVLLVVVFLLGLEWLSRKLLRLA